MNGAVCAYTRTRERLLASERAPRWNYALTRFRFKLSVAWSPRARNGAKGGFEVAIGDGEERGGTESELREEGRKRKLWKTEEEERYHCSI